MSLIINSTKAYSQDKKIAEIKIKTSAICDMCKETLEKNLAFEKGIKKSDLDVESKIITVTYNPEKISPEEIRKAIAKIGYDADDVPANKKAYDKLDGCCKKGAVCNDKK
jgi:copper chaperone CopZ